MVHLLVCKLRRCESLVKASAPHLQVVSKNVKGVIHWHVFELERLWFVVT